MPKVSIIVPIYNVARYLPKCIDSLVNQTLQDIEIILATDGPQDCHDICDEYAARDRRIVVIKDLGGYGKSVNEGIKIAQGEYIGIVESDDWCSENMYEELYKKASQTKADVVKSGFVSVVNRKHKKSKCLEIGERVFRLDEYPELISYTPSIWAGLYKRDFLLKNKIFFMEERLSFIDTPFYMEVLLKAERIAFLNKFLYYYNCDNPEQSVKSKKKVLDGILADEYGYQRIKDLEIFPRVKKYFYAAAINHLLWNYNRIEEGQHKQFWERAKSYVRQWGDDDRDFSAFSPEPQKLWSYLTSENKTVEEYDKSRRKIERIKFFRKITLLRRISENGIVSYYLFKNILVYRRKEK